MATAAGLVTTSPTQTWGVVPQPFNLAHFILANKGDPAQNPYRQNGVANGSTPVMDAELRALNMIRHFPGGNTERCHRLLCHYNTPQLSQPHWYHRMPLRFYNRYDFWLYHSAIIQFLHRPTPRLLCVFAITWGLHYASYLLFTIRIEVLGFKFPSCAALPVQPWCSTLKSVQDYTFNALDDFGKMLSLLFVNALYNNIIPPPRPS